MFDIIFGIIWNVFVTIIYLSLKSEGRVNTLTTVAVVIFWVVGISTIISGIKGIMKKSMINKIGFLTYGVIMTITPGRRGEREMLAHIDVVREDGSLKRFSAKLEPNIYRVGDFVSVKYYKNSLNVISLEAPENIPASVREKLVKVIEMAKNRMGHTFDKYDGFSYKANVAKHQYMSGSSNTDTIVIDGKKYERKL